MKKFVGITALLLILMVTFACSSRSTPPPAYTDGRGETSQGGTVYPAPAPALPPGIKVPAPTITVTSAPTSVPRPTPTPTPSPTPAPGMYDSNTGIDRMIVRTGQMTMLVDDIPTAIDKITQLNDSFKGYIVSSNTWKEGERLRGAITLRVPSGDFGNIMKSIAALAVEVTSQTTSAQDVTQEYTDLTAKLRNLEATEQQLLKIMQQAVKVEDILSVQRELTNTRSQIESIKARTLYLERTSATSLININLEQAKLDVKFTADRVSVNAGESVRFNVQLAGGKSPFSYDWDFGDGGKSTNAAPSHDYKAEGTYSVTVKVSDDRGKSASLTRKDYITVSGEWSAGGVVGGAWRGLVVFGQVLMSILIWLGIFSPVWIVGGGIWYWIWRRRKTKVRS